MFIVDLNEGNDTLEDIERICRHFIEHKDIVGLMTSKETEEFAYILKPSLRRDHDEFRKREHWKKLLEEFVMYDADGNELRFHRDCRTKRLFFGDQEGFDTIEDFIDEECEEVEALIDRSSQTTNTPDDNINND